MSYILQIWQPAPDRPLPATIEEAVASCDAAELQADAPDRFEKLARRLEHFLPPAGVLIRQSGEDLEPADVDCAWSEDEIGEGPFTDPVLVLGINSRMLDQVHAVVGREAPALGFAVLDPQAGRVWLPDGRSLATGFPPPRDESAVDPNELMSSKRELLAVLVEGLAPLMRSHGYKVNKAKASFSQSFPGGWHRIEVYCAADRLPLSCKVELRAYTHLDAVTDLAFAIARPEADPAFVRESETALALQKRWYREPPCAIVPCQLMKQYELKSRTHIEPVLTHMRNRLQELLLPQLKACETLAGLNALMNPAEPQNPVWQRGGGLRKSRGCLSRPRSTP